MDITLARTFLEIVEPPQLPARGRAAARHADLGQRARAHARGAARPQLFVRNKAGAALTAAGEQFLPHATTLVQVWERARHQVAVPPGSRAVLAIGCEISLWDPLLLDWLLWMRSAAPAAGAAHARSASRTTCSTRWPPGVLDIAMPMRRSSGRACASSC